MITTVQRMLLVALFLILGMELFSQTIPQSRTVDWTQAGLLQNINEPNIFLSVMDFGAVGDGLTNDYPAVQEAIDAMNNQPGVLYFPEGTYLLSQTIVAHTGLVIRGDGANDTRLKFFLESDNVNAIQISSSQITEFQAIQSGYEIGSQNLTLNSTGGFQIGDFLEMRQENGDWDIVPIGWASKVVGQVLQISQISESVLMLEHALRFNYEAVYHPELRMITPIKDVVVENLKIERLDEPESGGGKNIYMAYAVNCRISGVESVKSQGSHIYISNSSNIHVFGNYIHDAFLFDGTDTRGYGITLNMHAGEVLVENNIFKNLRHAMMVKTGANGNVFTYNYSCEPHRSEPISDYSGDISVHGHYAYANLFEENICQNIIIDHYWGPGGPYNTFFRNRTELYGLLMTTNSILETVDQNFVGNEITNSFPYGFYFLTGSGHFEYGNNDGGNAVPNGTSDLTDISYFYNERPWFVESSYPFPAIGFPHSLNQWSNPAKDRYLDGPMTVEIEHTVSIEEWSNRDHLDLQIRLLQNPVLDDVLLEVKGFLPEMYVIYNITGQEVSQGQIAQNINIQIPVAQLESGIYLLEIYSESARRVLKFYKK
ncbi:MAG: T9SS type A sorting domain-containing protein [Bacteroidales bacterium]|nr:T9SS type A sorting domain-containing protein [Bacteroidales bacterium]